MKVGILTFHRANNYGAVLQVYALQNICKSIGCDVEIIDYRCNAIEMHYTPIVFPKFNKNIIKWVKLCIKYILIGNAIKTKEERYNEFRSRLNISQETYRTEKEKIESKYDVIITGSDQVWSFDVINELNDWYCYRKNSNDTKVISYAASAGSLITFRNNFDFYGEIIRCYSDISVRELNLKNFLINNGIKDVSRVLDPTLLMNINEWNRIISSDRVIQKKYILYYDVENNEDAKRIAIDLARKERLKLVVLNKYRNISLNSLLVIDAGPIEFLNLIKNAEYIVGSSFHLVVFSIIFEKKFLSLLHPKTGDRVRELLCELKLENRIMSKNDNALKIKNSIDYNDVKKKLEELKIESIEYLKKHC